jgi:hypothetical protein
MVATGTHLSGVDHETVGELHRLGTSSTELARDDNLATLGAGLHDEAEDTVAGTARERTTPTSQLAVPWSRLLSTHSHSRSSSLHRSTTASYFADCSTALRVPEEPFARKMNSPPDGKTSQELVPQRLALSDGVQSTVLNLLGVELDGSLGELEPLLDEGGELPDPASLLAENLLGVGGADDDLGAGVGDADLAARVSLRGEGAGEELGKLGAG